MIIAAKILEKGIVKNQAHTSLANDHLTDESLFAGTNPHNRG